MKYIIDIKGEIEGDYEIIGKYEERPMGEREKGKWIEDDDGWDGVLWRCSECAELFCLVDGTPEENEYHFCPNCGAKMEVEHE